MQGRAMLSISGKEEEGKLVHRHYYSPAVKSHISKKETQLQSCYKQVAEFDFTSDVSFCHLL